MKATETTNEGNEMKVSGPQLRVAQALGAARVCKSSDLAHGKGNYIKKDSPETDFSTEAETRFVKLYPHNYPVFVKEFVRKNPRVQKVVYSTNTRTLNKILSA